MSSVNAQILEHKVTYYYYMYQNLLNMEQHVVLKPMPSVYLMYVIRNYGLNTQSPFRVEGGGWRGIRKEPTLIL